jgi:serine/threonine protein kinase
MDGYNVGDDGNILEKYFVKSMIGQGGRARVYLAYDPKFDRDIALKIFPQRFGNDPSFRKRFKLHSRIVMSIEHKYIVPVYDFNEEFPFIATRLMSGGSLSDKFRSREFSINDAARIISRIAPALDFVHSKNIAHRNLKPSQILFDESGLAYLTDFSMVKIFDEFNEMSSNIIGTPAYLSPEQWQGSQVDYRSDIYSLGIIIFYLLTGQLPYQAETPMAVGVKHIMDPVPNIHEIKPELPIDCQIIVEKTIAKNPQDRYENATLASEALASITRGERLVSIEADPIKIRQILREYFDESELQDLCFDLGVNYQGLPGSGTGDKARELVSLFIRHQNISLLVGAIKELRPNTEW